MIHSKFIVRCITYQEETEVYCTELYQKLLRYGGYDISDDELENFKYEWSRPKMLNSQNLGDLISTSDQLAEFITKVFVGDNSINDPRVRDRIYQFIVRNYLMKGGFDFDKMEKEINSVMLDLRAELREEESEKIEQENQ